MHSVNIFIISWSGQHENAVAIAKRILNKNHPVSIVYSDPDPHFTLNAPCKTIRRPDNYFWEDKFKACVDACQEGSLMAIHADCHSNHWESLLARIFESRDQFKNMGVWAPKVNGTLYELDYTRLFRIHKSPLNIVSNTDAIVFWISEHILDRMRKIKFGTNPYGWGIDQLFCAYAQITEQLVLVDESIEVYHPSNIRGYNTSEANAGYMRFLSQLDLREHLQIQLTQSHVRFNRIKHQLGSNKTGRTAEPSTS
jgi:hypothetical protein